MDEEQHGKNKKREKKMNWGRLKTKRKREKMKKKERKQVERWGRKVRKKT